MLSLRACMQSCLKQLVSKRRSLSILVVHTKKRFLVIIQGNVSEENISVYDMQYKHCISNVKDGGDDDLSQSHP